MDNRASVIPPSPKEYGIYTDQEKIEKTEEFYQNMAVLYRRMENSEQDYILRIDRMLQRNVARSEIIEVLHEKEAQLLCHYSYGFHTLDFLCNVAGIEEKFDECSVLRNVHGMDDVSLLHQKCVFLLRRFEMDWEENNEILILLQTKQVSYILLAEIICKEWISRKIYTGSRVFQYLYENGLKRDAILFLMWLEQRLPYSERKIMFFSMVLLDMGEQKLAYGMLLKHQNPDKDTKELINTLGEIL